MARCLCLMRLPALRTMSSRLSIVAMSARACAASASVSLIAFTDLPAIAISAIFCVAAALLAEHLGHGRRVHRERQRHDYRPRQRLRRTGLTPALDRAPRNLRRKYSPAALQRLRREHGTRSRAKQGHQPGSNTNQPFLLAQMGH